MQFEVQLALPDGHFRPGVLCKLPMRLVEEVVRLFDQLTLETPSRFS